MNKAHKKIKPNEISVNTLFNLACFGIVIEKKINSNPEI
jgi:hypothetical protein